MSEYPDYGYTYTHSSPVAHSAPHSVIYSTPQSVSHDAHTRYSASDDGPSPDDSISQVDFRQHASSEEFAAPPESLDSDLHDALNEAIVDFGLGPTRQNHNDDEDGEQDDRQGDGEGEREGEVDMIDRQPTIEDAMGYQPQTTKYSRDNAKVHLLHHDSGKDWKEFLGKFSLKGCLKGLGACLILEPCRTGDGCCSPTGCCEACECKQCCGVLCCPCLISPKFG